MMPTIAAAVVSSQPAYFDQNYGTFDPGPSQGRPIDFSRRTSSSESRDTFGVGKNRKRSASLAVLNSAANTPITEQPQPTFLVVRHVRSVPGIESPIPTPLVSHFSSTTTLPQASTGEADVGCSTSIGLLLRDFWRSMWRCGG